MYGYFNKNRWFNSLSNSENEPFPNSENIYKLFSTT